MAVNTATAVQMHTNHDSHNEHRYCIWKNIPDIYI